MAKHRCATVSLKKKIILISKAILLIQPKKGVWVNEYEKQ